MNIFRYELKVIRKSTMLWTCSLVAIMIVFLSMFPAFHKDAADFSRLLEGYPETVRKAFGISIDNMSTLLGYYTFVFGYIMLCGSIQALNLGISLLSKEVRDKTADFLLTKPVTRTRILTAKLLAALTSLVMTNIVYLVASSIMALQVKESTFDMALFLMISVTLLFVQLLFLALGVIMSVIIPKIRSILPLSLGTVFSFYVIGMLGSMLGGDSIRYITPFKYFEPSYIMKHAAYETSFIVLGIGLVITAVLASYVIYVKKDIHAV